MVLTHASPQPARVRAALAGLILAATLLSITSTADGAFPGRNGRIAVVASWPRCGAGAADVATLRPDGTGLRTLNRCGAWYSAEWFADGRRLLAMGRPRMSRTLGPWVMAADGTHRRPVKLDHPDVSAASLSPDGRHFTYNLPTRTPEDMDAAAEIWRARLDGKGERYIGDGWNPRWSPDGRRIAFVNKSGGLSVMDARTGRHVRVLAPDLAAHSIDWSPDSRWLAITQGSQVLAVSASGSHPTWRIFPRRRQPSLSPGNTVWSPDGRRLAFTRSHFDEGDGTVSYSIWTITRRGTHAKRIMSSDVFDAEIQGEEGGGTFSLSWVPRR